MDDEELIWGMPEELESAIEELNRNHPGWSQRVFLIYALQQYRDLDFARRRGNPDIVAEFLTPACLEALRDMPALPDIPIGVDGVQIAAVFEEGDYDAIDVRFIGQRGKDGAGTGAAYDYLRFVRYRYEQSTDGMTGETDRCPRCGGEIDATSDWKCRYCDQLVNPQSTGWLIEKVMDQGNYVA